MRIYCLCGASILRHFIQKDLQRNQHYSGLDRPTCFKEKKIVQLRPNIVFENVSFFIAMISLPNETHPTAVLSTLKEDASAIN